MNVLALAVPLTAVFGLTNLCGSSFACLPCFVLDASTDLSPLLACGIRLDLVVFTHRSGLPLTDTASQKLGTVGFPDVHPFHEEIEHTDIAPIVIHLELAPLEPGEQAGADVPAPLKREPVSRRCAIPMMGG